MNGQRPGIGTFLGAAGSCPEIAFEQHVYKIGHPTQRSKAVLEDLASAKAIEEIRRLKGKLPPDAYREMFQELTDSIAAGDYRTWGRGWQRIVLNSINSHLFLLALLRENHPNATEQLARGIAIGEPEQVGAALVRVVPGFFDLVLQELPLQEEQRIACEKLLQEALQKLNPEPSPLIVNMPTSATTAPTAPTMESSSSTDPPQPLTTPTSSASSSMPT